LEYARSLEMELGRYGLRHLVPIEPDEEREGESYERTHGISRSVLLFVALLKRLIDKDPLAAKDEYLAWSKEDDCIFTRLQIWIAGSAPVLSGVEAGRLICGLDPNTFWDSRHQRDLLLVLSRRWNDFSDVDRKHIEDCLLKGRSRREEETTAEHDERRASLSLSRIHWLAAQGRLFTFNLDSESAKLQALAPRWEPQHARSAAAALDSRSGWVQTKKSYSELIDIPLADLLKKASEMGTRTHERFVENDPFAGLASGRPVRALGALTDAARQRIYPHWAWRTFLNTNAAPVRAAGRRVQAHSIRKKAKGAIARA
jgi:hypothetical protein